MEKHNFKTLIPLKECIIIDSYCDSTTEMNANGKAAIGKLPVTQLELMLGGA